MSSDRPDPDALLARVKEEDQRAKSGKLKIFLGACAGVGKTYSMLEAARTRMLDGSDVVVGVVETHGRKETALVLLGLDILPRKKVEYQNVQLEEFDLDAAIARKPQWILIDELAHTNAPGCRHAKRWQDVQELLDNGINVFTTCNIQHVESLNDVVAQITGVIVRETVPDSVFEKAEEIEVIDLPPADLLKRLAEGKVYLAQQAERARQNFFKDGKLSALRELALRFTAEKVNKQVQSFHTGQTGAPAWHTKERILVCVGPSPSSARLIRAAKRLAESLRGDWIALHVETPSALAATHENRDRVIENLRLAQKLGGETATVNGEKVVEETVEFARSRNVTKIVVGKPVHSKWRDFLFGNVVDDLIRLSADMDVYVMRGDSENLSMKPLARLNSVRRLQSWEDYVESVVVVVAATALGYVIRPYLEMTNIVMVYLLGVVFIAHKSARGPATFISILSVLSFDFFFVEPRYSFSVSDTQYIFTFVVMLLVALIISTLTVRVRLSAESARLRERRITALHALSRKLASSMGAETLLEGAVENISEVFDCQVVAMLPDPQGKLTIRAGKDSAFAMNPKEQGVAQWVFDLGQVAGRGTETLPAAEALYVPLLGSQGPVGALGVRPNKADFLLVPDQLQLLEAFSNQTALALERDRLSEEGQRKNVEIETERLRGSLLSSVSHDLRTPLTSISGAASSLLEHGDDFSPATRKELLQTIHDEADRLARQVSNLLEMTRLESGQLKVTKEPQPLEETLGAALNRLDRILQARPVRMKLPADLPMVPIDAVLIEQVFLNLLENAAKYTPLETPLDISAVAFPDAIKVEIADRGPGFIEGDEVRVFDKFYRGSTPRTAPGTGLGLAICKGIILAHGGKLWAENREGGGAVFRFTLPL